MNRETTQKVSIGIQTIMTILLSVGSWFLYEVWTTTKDTSNVVHTVEIKVTKQDAAIYHNAWRLDAQKQEIIGLKQLAESYIKNN